MRRALLLATDHFDDPAIPNLRSPRSDARALKQLFDDSNIGVFDEVDLVADPDLRTAQIAVEKACAGAHEEDTLLLFLSGHGIPDPRGGLLYCVRDTDVAHLHATTLRGQFVREALESCGATRQVMLLDCCYSGAFTQDFTSKDFLGPPHAEFFSGAGRAVLASSTAIQQSFETTQGPETATSVFSEAIIRGLRTGEADLNRDGFIGLRELYDYIYSQLRDGGGAQTPVITLRDVEGDLVIARALQSRRVPLIPEDLLDAYGNPYPAVRRAAIDEIARLALSNLDERVAAARAILRSATNDPDADVVAIAHSGLKQRRARRARRPSEFTGQRPAMQSEGMKTITLECRDLRSVIRRSAFAASRDEYRPFLNGALVKLASGTLTVVATDSYRLAKATTSAGGSDSVFIASAAELYGLPLPKTRAPVDIHIGRSLVEIEFSGRLFSLRLMDGTFPDYERLIPQRSEHGAAVVDRQALTTAVEDIAQGSSGPVLLDQGPDGIRVSSASEDRIVTVPTPVPWALGERIALNADFLISGLTATDDRDVAVQVQGLQPVTVRPLESDAYVYVLMPVRISA